MSSDDKSYASFLANIGDMLKQTMPMTDKSRDALAEAEAELHRLKMQVALAEERVEVLGERYRLERAVLMNMWETWRDEFTKASDARRSEALSSTPETRDEETA